MALIVIVVSDEKDDEGRPRVNVSATLEPAIKKGKRPTPAQLAAVRMIQSAQQQADEANDEDE